MVDKDFFTAGEVVSILEGLRVEFRVIATGVARLSEDMVRVEDALGSLEVAVDRFEDVLFAGIASIYTRLSALESKVR